MTRREIREELVATVETLRDLLTRMVPPTDRVSRLVIPAIDQADAVLAEARGIQKTPVVTHCCGTVSDEFSWRCPGCSRKVGAHHKAGCERIGREPCEHGVSMARCDDCYGDGLLGRGPLGIAAE